MGTAVQSILPVFESPLPGDLREWIDQHTLARTVLAAVNAEGRSALDKATDPNALPHSYMALSLLTYCYACGIYSSRDIELGSVQDAMVRHLCADCHPEARLLRGFRRHHRQRVKHCLAEVLQRIWDIHLEFEKSDPVSAARLSASLPGSRMECDVLFLNEAEERINWAVRRDCWEFDC